MHWLVSCDMLIILRDISHPSLFVFRSIPSLVLMQRMPLWPLRFIYFIAANLAHQHVHRASRQISQAPRLPSRKGHLASPRRHQLVSRQASPRQSPLAAPRIIHLLIHRASRRKKTYP